MCHLFRAEIDAYTESFKHIRTAAAAGSGAIAMLGDKCACSGSQNTRACRDIEGTCAISACTAGIHRLRRGMFIQVYLHGLFAHHPRQARDFLDGFTACTQAQQTLDKLMSRWNELKSKELPRLNERLREANLSTITLE